MKKSGTLLHPFPNTGSISRRQGILIIYFAHYTMFLAYFLNICSLCYYFHIINIIIIFT